MLRNCYEITFSICDIYNIGKPENAFDVIIASQVLHLLDNPKKAADELKRVAKRSVIVPICLLDNLNFFARVKVNIQKIITQSSVYRQSLFRLLGYYCVTEQEVDKMQ